MSELSEQAKEQLKKHGPGAAVGVIAAILAVQLMVPEAADLPDLPTAPPEIAQAEKQPRRAADRSVSTRVVSCGDSAAAKVTGDDLVGLVELGAGADSKCTVLFATKWERQPRCEVNGGSVLSSDETDLLVESVAGGKFSYRCGERAAVVPDGPRPPRPIPPPDIESGFEEP